MQNAFDEVDKYISTLYRRISSSRFFEKTVDGKPARD